MYGRPTKEKAPIFIMSTPSTVNHACNVLSLNDKGKPEAKPSSAMVAIRRFRNSVFKRLTGVGGVRETVEARTRTLYR